MLFDGPSHVTSGSTFAAEEPNDNLHPFTLKNFTFDLTGPDLSVRLNRQRINVWIHFKD